MTVSARRSRQHGFSLLEVLAALAILVLSLGSLLHVFASSVARTSADRKHSAALLVAKTVMAEQRAFRNFEPQSGTTAGVAWSIEYAAVDQDAASQTRREQLYAVSLTIELDTERNAGGRSFETRLIGPQRVAGN